MTLLQARAMENQAYVVGVNRCGQDVNTSYSGRSLIVDPEGTILADAGNHEGFVQADIDLAELTAYRQRFPSLAERREIAWNPVGRT